MKKYDVIIIGAGIAGLSISALLSKNGYSCLVVEKFSIVGGRSRTIERDGYIIDFGIHLMRYSGDGKASQLLKELGEKPLFVPTGKPLIYTDNKFVPLPKKPLEILKTDLLSLKSKFKLLGLFASVLMKKPPKTIYATSVSEWLRQEGIKESDLLDFVSLLSVSGIVCPNLKKASAGELLYFIKNAIRAKESVGYYIGGWKRLFEALVKRIEKNGEIMLSTKVERISLENGLSEGVVTNNGTFTSDVVISSVPLQEIHTIVDTSIFENAKLNYISNLEPTCGICIDFYLKKKISKLKSVIFTMEPATMGVFISNIDPSLAPPKRQLGTWFYQIESSKMNDKKFLELEVMRLKNMISQMFPNIWNFVEYERIMKLKMVDGAMLKIGQTSQERPAFNFSSVPNLFFIGDTTAGEGNGGDIAFDSAIKCLPLVINYLTREEEKV